MKIGILDIQGSVEEHFVALQKLKVQPVLVKNAEDLDEAKGLIMPGGESTTIGKLLKESGLGEVIKKRARKGMSIWGTCAGAILLAKEIAGEQKAESLKLVDVEIERNAFGRQLDSFETELEFEGKKIPAVFIRAPRFKKIGEKAKVLASYKGEAVLVREGRFLLSSFHPELTEDLSVHRYFVGMC